MTAYIDEDGKYPVHDMAHALRVGRALEVARRELTVDAIYAIAGPGGEATCAFVVVLPRSDLTLTIVVQ